MQTFITDFNLQKSAQNLDNKRLGKQRVEAIQIAQCLLIKETRWKNHPAVKMWRGYEYYLMYYIYITMYEWTSRGFKNTKCYENWNILNETKNLKLLSSMYSLPNLNKPIWITEDFIEAHRSNLIKKNPEYYKPLFPDTKEGLNYIWPV